MKTKRNTVSLADQIGTSVGRVDQTLDRLFEQDIYLRSITIKSPEEGVGEYFVIARFYVGGAGKVAFHSAGSFWEAVKGIADRMHNGSLTFKDDQWA